MNTKVNINFKPVNIKRWQSAIIVVDKEDVTEEMLAWGGELNYIIQQIVDDNGGTLDNWRLGKTTQTSDNADGVINYSIVKKPKKKKTVNKEIKDLKEYIDHQKALIELQEKTIDAMEDAVDAQIKAKIEGAKTLLLQDEINKIIEENIKVLVDDWGLTKDEAVWADNNWKQIEKENQYFSITPQILKNAYAKVHNVEPTIVPDAFDEIKPVKDNGDYIKVMEHFVPIQLFKDYMIHISKTNVKRWQMTEYEEKRVILHTRIFAACNADRIGRDEYDEQIRFQIDKIIRSVEKCTCGRQFNAYKRCNFCNKNVGMLDYFFNLNKIAVKKK